MANNIRSQITRPIKDVLISVAVSKTMRDKLISKAKQVDVSVAWIIRECMIRGFMVMFNEDISDRLIIDQEVNNKSKNNKEE